MTAKDFKLILKRFLFSSKSRKKKGFTLTELLVTILIAGFVITALMSFVVNLMDTERTEYARSETEREMQSALDFIAADLREAVYVYDSIEDKRDGDIAPLKDSLPDFGNAVPILAFWKAERLPYNSTQSIPNCGPPEDNPSDQKVECEQVAIRRRAYSLIVYLQDKNDTVEEQKKWKGESRILRYVLRKYSDVSSLTRTSGYADPSEKSGFPKWPIGDSKFAKPPKGSPDVLVDFVDAPDNKNIDTSKLPSCTSPDYERVPGESLKTKSTSFFVCVKTNAADEKLISNQDVIIYLRGNPKGKVNDKKNEPLVTLKTQAVARGVIDKRPQ